MNSPVGPVFNACLAAMGADDDFSVFFKEEQEREILKGIFAGAATAAERPLPRTVWVIDGSGGGT